MTGLLGRRRVGTTSDEARVRNQPGARGDQIGCLGGDPVSEEVGSAASEATSPPTGGGRERRREVVTVYAIGLFQGLSLVAFPAAAVPESPSGYDLSKGRYGLLFLPQVIMAIAGSLALPALAARYPLKRILVVGVAANALAMSLLVGSDPIRTDAIAYPMLLVATVSLGLGFGLTLSAISTYVGAFMPRAAASHSPH